MFNRRFDRSRFSTVGATAAAAILMLAGCATTASSGGDDKAGGSADPVVIRLAYTSFGLEYHPALRYFVDRVKELSDGALRIEVAQGWGDNAPDSEQQVVHDVAAGTIDLGSVGTQVFDTVGVTAFQALTAPMLIDNYPLQQAVLASTIPAEMLAGLDEIGLDGIAVLGDGLRKPIAVADPLLGPADYQGITFQAFRSQNHADAIEALGATPTDGFVGFNLNAGLRDGTIDGFEKGLQIYEINGTASLAPYVTANLNLWPHTLALIANPGTIADLTETERNWLTQAGADAASRSTDLTDDDNELIVELCASGSRFANASDTELEAMRHAFAPGYAALDNDPTTKGFIDRIDALKQATAPGPALEIPPGCTGPAAATPTDPVPSLPPSAPVATSLDGTYRWTITKEDALAHGTMNESKPETLATFPWVFTVTLKDGTMHTTQRDSDGDHDLGVATYTVKGDQSTVTLEDGSTSTVTFSVDDDGTLHLVPVGPWDPGDVFVTTTKPWDKID
jgi:TRAP-type C4-dicarboxylate transport system substrate-binding protein